MGLSNFDGEKEEGEGGGGHTKGGLGLVVPPLIFTSYVFPPKREKEVEGDTHGVASIGGEFFWVGAEIRDFSFHFDDKTGEKKGGRWIVLSPVPPFSSVLFLFMVHLEVVTVGHGGIFKARDPQTSLSQQGGIFSLGVCLRLNGGSHSRSSVA